MITPHVKGSKWEITYKISGYKKVFSERFDTIEEANLTKYPHEFPFLKCITQFCTREGMKCFRTITRWHSPSFLLSKDFSVKKV